MRPKAIDKLCESIGYRFRDEDLLINALTHSSYASEHDLEYPVNNERLEFIGDAFVDAVVGMKLFEIMGKAHEGELSKRRADVVCEDTLASAAMNIELGDYLYLGRGEDVSGGRQKPSILSDAFEALMGAIILDGGYEEGKRVILGLLDNEVKRAADGKLNRDFKTRLQEKVQGKNTHADIRYETIAQEGPDHNKTFTVRLLVNSKVVGMGRGKSKAKAEQAAAHDALLKGVL